MKKNKTTRQALPRGWTEKKIRALIDYYDNQSEEEQAAEIEAAYRADGETRISVPTSLVPKIQMLISRQQRNGAFKERAKRGKL